MRGMTMERDTTTQSCLYFGRVMHKRLQPFRHRLDYRVFSLYLDLDELPALTQRLRLFSHNRWNLFGFLDRDHGPRDGTALRPWIEGHLAEAGIELEGGAIRLLCFPRLLGYVFNPLSIWFCYHRSGRLAAMFYEVRNTFGEMHGYLIPVDPARAPGAPILQSCDKGFYVSPFIGMAATYHFRLAEPDARLSVLIRQWTPEGIRVPAHDPEDHRRHPLAGPQAVAQGCQAGAASRRTRRRGHPGSYAPRPGRRVAPGSPLRKRNLHAS
jgi:DUF1365 family protein